MTIPEIITSKRVDENLSSLNELERLTHKNRATILRYERGEAPIPREVAEIFAETYFLNPNERQNFIQQWMVEGATLSEERKIKSKRKKERTEAQASHQVKVIVRPITAQPHDLIEKQKDGSAKVVGRDIHYKYAGSWVFVGVYRKSDEKPFLHIDPSSYCYFDKDRKLIRKHDAVDALIKYSVQKQIGKYAIIDMIKKAIQDSDLFKESGNKKPFIALDKEVIAELKEILALAQGSRSFEQAMEYIDKAKIQIDFLHDKGNGLSNMKDALLKKVAVIESRIDEKLSTL